jgi:homopolymeric O-antigen transport system permease protein
MSREAARALPATLSRTGSRDLRHGLDVLLLLVRRDLRLRYRNSVLGMLWSVLMPVAQAAVLVFVFQVVVPLNIDAYPAFVLSALLPWTWFSTSVMSATGCFLEHRDMVRHPGFRPPLLVVITMISNLFLYVAALPMLFGVCMLYGRMPNVALAAFPLLVLAEAVLIVGSGLLAATLNVFFRDVYYIVGVLLMLLFYLTPVFYARPPTLPAYYHLLLAINPAAALIDAYRAIFFEGRWPDLETFVYSFAGSIVVLIVGWMTWRRREQEVYDSL